ncbi:Arc family DNA-binding protein [Stenotrophomonas sp. LARHCG68]
MSRDINPYGLRMPADLKAMLEESAQKAGRSLNAELVARLERSFDTKLTYQLLDRRAEEMSNCVLEWVRVGDELRELKGKRVDGCRDDQLEGKILQKERESKLLKRQHDRMAEEFDALLNDVKESLPRLEG